MISYSRAKINLELKQILDLQKRNFPEELEIDEIKEEGFVTVRHTFQLLKKLNKVCPHIIAKRENEVIGYALCMDPQFKNEIEVLQPMFEQIEELVSHSLRYIAMGQICIAKNERGKGVFNGLYDFMASELHKEYDAVITEVDFANVRSMNAHLRYGFKSLKEFESDNHHWNIIIKYYN